LLRGEKGKGMVEEPNLMTKSKRKLESLALYKSFNTLSPPLSQPPTATHVWDIMEEKGGKPD
jgi:hypothetical protein